MAGAVGSAAAAGLAASGTADFSPVQYFVGKPETRGGNTNALEAPGYDSRAQFAAAVGRAVRPSLGLITHAFNGEFVQEVSTPGVFSSGAPGGLSGGFLGDSLDAQGGGDPALSPPPPGRQAEPVISGGRISERPAECPGAPREPSAERPGARLLGKAWLQGAAALLSGRRCAWATDTPRRLILHHALSWRDSVWHFVGDVRLQRDLGSDAAGRLVAGGEARASLFSQELRLPLLSALRVAAETPVTLYEHLAGRWSLVHASFPARRFSIRPDPGYALFQLEAEDSRPPRAGEALPPRPAPLLARGLYLKAPLGASAGAGAARARAAGFQVTVDGVCYSGVTVLYLTGTQLQVAV